MEPILIIGIIIFTGFIGGELCTRIGLPKVTGYILAGLILNPELTHFIPESFVGHTTLVTNIALSFITFSVGGTLLFPKIRSLGKSIIFITLFEAEFAFLFVIVFFTLLGPVVISLPDSSLTSFFIPLALLIGSLASPTDPSATLAVEHEYQAKGEVTSTIMGVAAFDDILGIINYSLAVSVAGIFILHQSMGVYSVVQPFIKIVGSIIGGCLFGFFLNVLSKFIKKETEGVLITLIISLLSLCYGLAAVLGTDELLSTMTMGVVVVNYNAKKEKIFKILERYTEELIFVLFFTISAMHLDFSVMASNFLLIILFIVFRSLGKLSGTVVGGKIAKSPQSVQRYTAGGLIPQGGIVIGLALVIKQNPAFNSISDIILNVIIGATIIHEIVGPLSSKFVLEKAGEITSNRKSI
ncbi:MAG TPA: cation:proton antiporter [Syntrophales bacterium]|mgnify:CR=1 FL=1|nr:cation:proton antiporter [Syntrophales bacterium]